MVPDTNESVPSLKTDYYVGVVGGDYLGLEVPAKRVCESRDCPGGEVDDDAHGDRLGISTPAAAVNPLRGALAREGEHRFRPLYCRR